MPSKRKRDILENFDPNASDPEDENFDPTDDRPPRSSKKSRSSKSRRTSGGKSRPRSSRYRGSDIEDDEDEVSESGDENSFVEDDDDDEEDEDLPITSSGRRMRKAAVKHQSYKESSEDEDEEPAQSDSATKEGDVPDPAPRPSRIVVLKTNPRSQRVKREPAMPPPTRRSTRARTEETEEPLVELSNSGRHVQVARASRSRSPETVARTTRATRGAKGLKRPPEPIQEATQESDPRQPPEGVDGRDELAPSDDEHRSPEEEAAEPEAAADVSGDEKMEDVAAEVAEQAAEDGDDDDDDVPVTRRTRAGRAAASAPSTAEEAEPEPENGKGRRLRRKSQLRGKKNVQEPSSDFEPGDESGEAEMSASEASAKKGPTAATTGEDDSSSPTPARGRGGRSRSSRKTRRSRPDSGDEEVELDKDEMAEELEELRESSRSRPRRRRRSPSIQYEERLTKKRRTKPVDYSIPAIDLAALEVDEEEEPTQTPAKGRRGGKNGGNQVWERNFNSTYGPFGGGGGPGALLGGPWGTGATGGVDSDSSDDEMVQRSGIGGTVGMTPTSAAPPVGLFNPLGPANNDTLGGIGGATPNVGKLKNQKAFADADPLGVDMSVDFSKVGGLQGHIDQLKEMVQLPLLYPELFLKFHVTPPRGVLFHGPPGTGKTLLARALANSVGIGGRKISFYMRKGADALSKWVGEAEKQLRLLFEEARRTQPSIIFFDEIDGLAPVRSSKQEQIHASIVSTLLALMDGMDGRGQVIVIGATNRPDNIDPALRRPGRFDREFYFPLPDLEARRAILDIHTKDWGISPGFKDKLAENTKGYGGADLRALCTEAALNAIQRTYPQIYSSTEKLVVDPEKITIHATDFILSAKKMIPSSERSSSSSATPLPRSIEPLLKDQYDTILSVLDNILPRPKKVTALEEAMYEQPNDADHGFGKEAMHQEFERSRIFRPRLLIAGVPGMGQSYLAAAVLHHLEGVHIQHFDLATLLGDGRPCEQVIVGLFTEVRRHKPSVIFIPNVDVWWASIGEAATTTFTTMLRTIPPADPVLLLGTSETNPEDLDQGLLQSLFGFSKRNRAVVDRPNEQNRTEFFGNIIAHLRKSPPEFPDPADRKKRVLEDLPVAPPPPPKQLTKEEIKAQRKADLHHLNLLKMRLQPIMDQIHRKYRKFRQPVIPFAQIAYLFDESDPNFVRPDIVGAEQRPFEIAKDKEGTQGIRDTATGKFFYNLETTTIEERLANGYYARPIDFYKDINRLYLDAKNIGDRDRTLKANELRTNVEVDVHDIGQALSNQGIRFEEIYQRQLQRVKEAEEKERKRKALQPMVDLIQTDLPDGDSDSQGPVGIGLPMPRTAATTGARFMVMSPKSNGHTGSSHPLTNGTSASGQDGEDVVMSDVNADTQAQVSQPSGTPFSWGGPPPPRSLGDSTRAVAGTQMSQRSAVTTVPPGVSPSAIANDASTTKTSEPSTNRGEVNWSTQHSNTQHTNGLNNSNVEDDTLLIDTQSQNRNSLNSLPSQATSGERDWAHSQAAGLAQGLIQPRMGIHIGYPDMGLNLSQEGSEAPSSSQRIIGSGSGGGSARSSSNKSHNVTSLGNILNDEPSVVSSNSNGNNSRPTPSSGGTQSLRHSGSTSVGSSQQPVIHDGRTSEFLAMLVDRTSGCSVEQLEQINRELMDEIWRTRGEWNRMKVLSALTSVFNDTIGDIELVQGMLEGSQAGDKSQGAQVEEEDEDSRPYIVLRREEERQRAKEAAAAAAGVSRV
ncbi:Tat-binding 7 [Echria macrotheca]|uniref:Tat-binding 7 n=1 Tax=Echria macrotheca TaxID=438768 RepID=A0AAJ0BE26_9PEZI|nr:Tat-binding 7 [Echria macrotheca]